MLNRFIMGALGNRAMAVRAALRHLGRPDDIESASRKSIQIVRVATFPIALILLLLYLAFLVPNFLFLWGTYLRARDKKRFGPYRRTWEVLYEHWRKMPCSFIVKATEAALYRDVIEEDLSRSLEIGVYTGETARAVFLDRRFDVGLEYNVDRLLRYQRGIQVHDRLVSADVRRLPFTDGAFRSVYCLHSIDDMELPASEAIQEMSRVLAPKGKLFLSGLTRNATRFNLAVRLLRSLRLGRAADWVFDTLYIGCHNMLSTCEWERLLAEAGLRLTVGRTFVPFGFGGFFDLALRPELILLNFFHWEEILRPLTRRLWFRTAMFQLASAMVVLSEKKRAHEGINFFLVAEKEGPESASRPPPNWCCPECRSLLASEAKGYVCSRCKEEYAQVQGIPLLIPKRFLNV